MKTNIAFDEINSFDKYYEPMQIDIGSKARRRELAEYLTDAFLFFFSTFEVHDRYNSLLQKQLYQQLLADRISEAVTKVTGIDSYMSDHIKEMSKEVVNTTFKNAKYTHDDNGTGTSHNNTSPTPLYHHNTTQAQTQVNPTFPSISNPSQEPLDVDPLTNQSRSDGSTRQDDSYWLSYRRAEDIAKSEANTFLNYTDYLDAKAEGKTKKTWLTMLDDKVRGTHSEIEGRTIGIDESFVVGNSLMKFPHDLSESPDPKEVINCRCAVEYK